MTQRKYVVYYISSNESLKTIGKYTHLTCKCVTFHSLTHEPEIIYIPECK